MSQDEPQVYEMIREEDPSGVSGTGRVGWVVEFPDGHAVVRWDVPGIRGSTACHDFFEDVESIHGHGGKTRFRPLNGGSRNGNSSRSVAD